MVLTRAPSGSFVSKAKSKSGDKRGINVGGKSTAGGALKRARDASVTERPARDASLGQGPRVAKRRRRSPPDHAEPYPPDPDNDDFGALPVDEGDPADRSDWRNVSLV